MTFNPDWSELDACRESLREHMDQLKKSNVAEEYWRLLAARYEMNGDQCVWKEDEDGVWDTECGNKFACRITRINGIVTLSSGNGS